MSNILLKVSYFVKSRLLKQLRKCRNAGQRIRYLIIVNLANGRGAYETAKVLGIHNTTVYRVLKRFRVFGEWGLMDSREDSGEVKLDERYLATLYRVVRSSPQQHGWRRPMWTRELLVATLAKKTGITIHVATMSRALALIDARRGRPRPTVGCPWSVAAKNHRIKEIRRLLTTLPADEMAVYEDEVDIHLNPKIGSDWMVRGQQKEVLTPGQNVKRYLAGALDVRSGTITWVEGTRKTSALFIALLDKLIANNPKAKVIHVILDNYRIHSSKIVAAALQAYGKRVQLHPLPPYCPNDNRIERVWQDLHANVTRNHQCPDMDSLMKEVRDFLWNRNRQKFSMYYRRAA